MARTFTYTFTEPANTSIVVTTEDDPRPYTVETGTFPGYRVTAISGTFNGQNITGVLPSNNGTNSPNTTDANPSGGEIFQQFNNVIWLSDTSGNGSYSFFGVDNRGLAFTAGGTDQRVFSRNGSRDFFFDNSDPADQNMTLQSSNAPCYVTGTAIRTVRGEVAVEALQVGDIVVTASGEERPIRWIGNRKVECRSAVDRAGLLPVRIAAGAFGEGRPARNLLVSPGHHICVDVLGEVLIPAIRLVNGTTITQVDVETVTYWHVELESHDILLAEGLPAESYLDMGNRGFFGEENRAEFDAKSNAPESHAGFCRPALSSGVLVEALRQRLADQARQLGWRLEDNALAGLHVVADGRIIRPNVDGLTARFVVSADAHTVHLVSHVSVPAHVEAGTRDDRRLGVSVRALSIDDGLTGRRDVPLDHTDLTQGFHGLESGAEGERWRWTDGRAVLDASLWQGCQGVFFLRVELNRPSLPRWLAPGEIASVVDLAEARCWA